MFIGTATSAAPGEFAVNHDSRHAANAKSLRFGRHVGLVHVMDDNLVGRTGNPPNEFDGFLAR